jgi:hypothetical protein
MPDTPINICIFPPSFQGNHVKITDSPATVTAKTQVRKLARRQGSIRSFAMCSEVELCIKK